MKDITLMDVVYTAAMLFMVFYGSIILTKFFSRDKEEDEER
ncbi:MAG: hypothetical protein PHO65_08485 [Sulfurovum sp.]|nr:hypothetical protein [Sulfurovum sp.]